MFLAIDIFNLIYINLFLVCCILSYFIILSTRLENLFKKGHIWQIRFAQVMLAIIIGYLLSSGLMSFIKAFQI